MPLHNVYALSHIDYFTACNVLDESVAYCIRNKGEPAEFINGDYILTQSYYQAMLLLKTCNKRIVLIVCMPEALAKILDVKIIDKLNPNHFERPSIDAKQIKFVNKDTELPIVNYIKSTIDREIYEIQTKQIMSYYNTLYHAMTQATKEYLQHNFLDWLTHKITTEMFKGNLLRKTNERELVQALVDFMSSERGAYYQKVFPKILAGEQVMHDITIFECNYFRKLLDRKTP